MAMSWLDTISFASMVVLLLGAINWGVVAIRYAVDDLPDMVAHENNLTKTELYIPDLLDTLSASLLLQIVVYWVVFGSGILYMFAFVYSSIERREVTE